MNSNELPATAGVSRASAERRFFSRWGETIVRFRWVCIALTLVGTGFFARQIVTKLRVDTTTEAFMASDSGPARALEELRDEFGMDSYFQIVVTGDVFTMPYLERLRALHDRLARIDLELESLGKREAERLERRRTRDAPFRGVAGSLEGDHAGGWGGERGGSVLDEITSLVNVRQTSWRDEGLHVGGLLEEWPNAAALTALRERVLHESTLVGRLVGKDGKHSVIVLKTASLSEEDSARVHAEVERITAEHQKDGFQIHVAGLPALNATMNRTLQDDFGRMFAICVLLMVLILTVIFQHPIGVAAPILVVIQAAVWTLGLMAMTDTPMTLVTNIMPAFLICVGIGDSVHLLSVYRDERASGADTRRALVQAVATTGLPVTLTAATTCAALLGLTLAQLEAIQGLGLFAAYGVFIALVHSLVFLPAVLTFHQKGALGLRPAAKRRKDGLDRVLTWCRIGSWRRGGRHTVLVSAAVLAVVAATGIARLGLRHDPM
jgi:uncharacterized protein